MPYGWCSTSIFTTSAGGDIGGGRNYTRMKGPLLLGSVKAATGWPSDGVQVPHIANVSTTPADLIMTAGVVLTTSSTTGYVYIPISAAGFTSSNTANVGPTPTPGILKGAALIFNSDRNKLSVYSTDVGDWLSVTLTSS